ncbi:MAG: fatty acid desaturase [Gammaproteobacteria bacterium]
MSTTPADASLPEVCKSLKVDWYRCPIDPSKLRELLERSDLQGWLQCAGHLGLFACTGLLTYYFFEQHIWLGFALCLFVHGTVASFFSGLAVHELGHGTVFRTRWLNRFFLRIYSLLGWWNHHEYAMSHTYHHRYTLHPEGDREVELPRYPSLEVPYLVQLFTFNVSGGLESNGFLPIVRSTLQTAFGRYRTDKGSWFEDLYAHESPALRARAVNWARLILLFHLGILVVSMLLKLWLLPILLTFSIFIANWLKYFVGLPMHCGLRDNVADFRLCVRTIRLDPISEFLYWRMNWHTEHHMFAAVPCYNLQRLHNAVAHDMPAPRTLLGAWREMRATWRRQRDDPGYQFDTPLPPPGQDTPAEQDPLAASIGDIAPPSLRT